MHDRIAMPDGTMTGPLEALVLDLLEWIGPDARPYDETIEAWRTSCPRLPVWEEATARGFIQLDRRQGSEPLVSVSAEGRRALRAARRPD
jgi:D-3-phosphoglycerate dehydrogenase